MKRVFLFQKSQTERNKQKVLQDRTEATTKACVCSTYTGRCFSPLLSIFTSCPSLIWTTGDKVVCRSANEAATRNFVSPTSGISSGHIRSRSNEPRGFLLQIFHLEDTLCAATDTLNGPFSFLSGYKCRQHPQEAKGATTYASFGFEGSSFLRKFHKLHI